MDCLWCAILRLLPVILSELAFPQGGCFAFSSFWLYSSEDIFALSESHLLRVQTQTRTWRCRRSCCW